MTARRLLILLLMWLVPLYPVLAGAATHLPAASYDTHAVMMAAASQTAHDCCDTASASQHALMDIDQGCDAGQCIAHCAISLVAIDIGFPARLDYIYAHTRIAPLSGITLSPPSRPPSLL